MLAALGYDSVDALVQAAVPASIHVNPRATSDIPPAATEAEALAELRELASQNRVARPMIGLGYYDTFTPSVISRNVLENPSWYTAYTPYQPEISQGRLEALINFQTMVTDLTGLATANASMLDESTAVVEGMLVARRASKSASNVFLVDADTLPQTKAVLEHRAAAVGIQLRNTTFEGGQTEDVDAFGAFIQYPGASGRVWDPSEAIAAVKARGGLVVVAADLLALALLRSPGSLGADVAVGTTQRFGVPLGFGGPHAGYMAVRSGLERQLPGRLVGVSQDAAGRPAYRLSLQTREQHIRREKATSNICTAQVLLAVMAAMYAVYHGPQGLRAIATEVARKTEALAERLRSYGLTVQHDAFFDTIRVVTTGPSERVIERARSRGYQLFWATDAIVGISVDETTTPDDLAAVAWAFGLPDADEHGDRQIAFADAAPLAGVADTLLRDDEYLTHPVFNTHRSETAMMRYLKQLADRDYALDRGMIPLGSCTMKLNAATEMAAVSWPEFSRVHPFAPEADVHGYLAMIEQLETWLAEVTGYDAVSLQPNAGSQGELAGLMAIRGFHRANGELDRTICLIPSSAHGTNAASAVL
ncbi:MAG: glycine dehydrogenase (aminomethyl-transferring), partial [Microbacterium sp.]